MQVPVPDTKQSPTVEALIPIAARCSFIAAAETSFLDLLGITWVATANRHKRWCRLLPCHKRRHLTWRPFLRFFRQPKGAKIVPELFSLVHTCPRPPPVTPTPRQQPTVSKALLATDFPEAALRCSIFSNLAEVVSDLADLDEAKYDVPAPRDAFEPGEAKPPVQAPQVYRV